MLRGHGVDQLEILLLSFKKKKHDPFAFVGGPWLGQVGGDKGSAITH